MESCTKAKGSSDARDKFFLELVTEVDLSAGVELQRTASTVYNASALMTKNLSALSELIEPIKTCLEGKEATALKLTAVDAEATNAMEFVARFGMLDRMWSKCTVQHLVNTGEELESSSDSFAEAASLSSTPGLSQEQPVEDCYSLKSSFNKFTSGFYWVLPLCAPNALRAFCDISSGGTYVTLPENDNIVSVNDAVAGCASE